MICRALKDAGDQVTSPLWTSLLSSSTPQNLDAVLPTAAALAVFAPKDERWNQAKSFVADALVSADPRFLDGWLELLRPTREYFIEPLENTFYENSPQSAGRRRQATAVLSEYLADDPQQLVALLLDADIEQFRQLFPSVARNGNQAVTVLTEVINRGDDKQESPSPAKPAETTLDTELLRQLKQAGGVLTSRYAFCTSLNVDDFRKVSAHLDSLGYCPKRVRPYTYQGTLRTAAMWGRMAWRGSGIPV